MDPPEKGSALDPDCLAAEGFEGAEVAPLAARLQRYGTAKGRTYAMAGHVLQAAPVLNRPLAKRLYQCGSFLHFRHWLAHGKTTLHAARFCGVPLLCPLCAIRRSAKLLRRYVERAEFIARDHDLWLVTLTVKNGPDLAERHEHLRGGIRKLRKRAEKGYGAFATSEGALWSTEFTKRPETGWHPHVHMVWAMTPGATIRWGEGSQLAEDWRSITGDSYIVHAERITGENLVASFLEVLKYSLKFAGLDLADNFDAYRALRGKRLLSSCGIWWGLDLPEDARLTDDPLDGPFIDLLYRWAGERGYLAMGESGLMGTPTHPEGLTDAHPQTPRRADADARA
jgi:hypothetical protein